MSSETETALFRPLGRDYWPEETRFPYLRLFLAFVVAPLVVAACLGVFVFAVYALHPDELAAAQPALAAVTSFLRTFFPLTLLGGAPAVALLWSLRLSSRRAYLAAGLAIGGAGALAREIDTKMASATDLVVFLVAGAVLMQAIRLFAGLRSCR